MFHFLIHMNRGTHLVPKIWVGDHTSDEVFFGSLGKTLIRKRIKGQITEAISKKTREGYVDLMTFSSVNSIQAIADFFHAILVKGVKPAIALDSFGFPEKDALLSACKRLGVSTFVAAVQDAPEPPQTKPALPSRLETASGDGAWSW